MHYAEMVSLPVTALIQLDYDTYSNLINSCMHEIIVLERKQHDESDPIKYYGYSIKLYKLNRVFGCSGTTNTTCFTKPVW
jgi:hypothetical protein